MSGQALPIGARTSASASYDLWIIGVAAALLTLGVVMVGSASLAIAERASGEPLHYLVRQIFFCGVGIGVALLLLRVPIVVWEHLSAAFLVVSLVLLLLVLVPGIGRTVNGSTRWISLGLFNLQPSELMKLAMVLYLAGYLVRREAEVRSRFTGFLKPGVLLAITAGLLLAEPDFGAVAVIAATALGMLFLGGARLWQFMVVVIVAAGGLAGIAVSSPYRMDRLTSFLDPWAEAFSSGYQLTQALIAFGRGELLGVGLGSGVQKLFYLPEAHTDFVFAVLGEELGLVGALTVLALFAVLVWRAFVIGAQAHEAGRGYAAYLAYGLGLWIGLQVVVSVGVNTGLLPTKGLALPFISYGGSSLVVNCMALALLLRVDHELRTDERVAKRARRAGGTP